MNEPVEISVAEITRAGLTAEGPHIRCGMKYLYELKDGEKWMTTNVGGIIVTHPDRAPKWIRHEDGKVVESILTALSDAGVKDAD